MDKGINYDFGIMIAQGTVAALTKTVAAATALAGTTYALAHAIVDLDEVFKVNQVALGGYNNTLKALEFVTHKIASGATEFAEEDIFAGIKLLKHAGIDAKKNFDIINKSAQATGMSFTDMASAIEGGSFSTLSNAGIITKNMAATYDRMGYTAEQSTKKIMQLIKQADANKLFDGTIKTLPGILHRFSAFGKELMIAIIGDPKDPNGLGSTIKRIFTEVADFMYHKLEKIKMIGAMVGKILVGVVNFVWRFVKLVGKSVADILHINDKFFDNFGKKMLSLGLWLELVSNKIIGFFEEHGKAIKIFGEILLAYFAFRMLDEGLGKILRWTDVLVGALDPAKWKLISNSGLIKTVLETMDYQMMLAAESAGTLNGYMAIGDSSGARFFATMKAGVSALGSSMLWMVKNPVAAMMGGIQNLISVFSTLSTWLLANPFTALLIALPLIIIYWDEITEYCKGVSDAMLGIIAAASYFLGPIGLIVSGVMLIAKYWTEIKTIGINIGTIIVNLSKRFGLWLGQGVAFLKTFSPIKAIFEFIDKAISRIGGWITKILSIGGSFLGKVFGGMADASTHLANQSAIGLANASGKKVDPNSLGVSTKQVAEADAKAKAKTSTPATPAQKTGATTHVSGNSVAIEPGAITINVKSASPEEAKNIADMVIQMINDRENKAKTRGGH